jgi:hypothetical protein
LQAYLETQGQRVQKIQIRLPFLLTAFIFPQGGIAATEIMSAPLTFILSPFWGERAG